MSPGLSLCQARKYILAVNELMNFYKSIFIEHQEETRKILQVTETKESHFEVSSYEVNSAFLTIETFYTILRTMASQLPSGSEEAWDFSMRNSIFFTDLLTSSSFCINNSPGTIALRSTEE